MAAHTTPPRTGPPLATGPPNCAAPPPGAAPVILAAAIPVGACTTMARTAAPSARTAGLSPYPATSQRYLRLTSTADPSRPAGRLSAFRIRPS